MAVLCKSSSLQGYILHVSQRIHTRHLMFQRTIWYKKAKTKKVKHLSAGEACEVPFGSTPSLKYGITVLIAGLWAGRPLIVSVVPIIACGSVYDVCQYLTLIQSLRDFLNLSSPCLKARPQFSVSQWRSGQWSSSLPQYRTSDGWPWPKEPSSWWYRRHCWPPSCLWCTACGWRPWQTSEHPLMEPRWSLF